MRFFEKLVVAYFFWANDTLESINRIYLHIFHSLDDSLISMVIISFSAYLLCVLQTTC